MARPYGNRNKQADEVLRLNIGDTWSDGELDRTEFPGFKKLKCTCGNEVFHVAQTEVYETSARCTICLKWFVVHTG